MSNVAFRLPDGSILQPQKTDRTGYLPRYKIEVPSVIPKRERGTQAGRQMSTHPKSKLMPGDIERMRTTFRAALEEFQAFTTFRRDFAHEEAKRLEAEGVHVSSMAVYDILKGDSWVWVGSPKTKAIPALAPVDLPRPTPEQLAVRVFSRRAGERIKLALADREWYILRDIVQVSGFSEHSTLRALERLVRLGQVRCMIRGDVRMWHLNPKYVHSKCIRMVLALFQESLTAREIMDRFDIKQYALNRALTRIRASLTGAELVSSHAGKGRWTYHIAVHNEGD